MPPKQVKSRNGCFACKARHIKCDEALPVCTNCIRRKVECSYPASRYTSTTTSGSQGSPSRANSDSDWWNGFACSSSGSRVIFLNRPLPSRAHSPVYYPYFHNTSTIPLQFGVLEDPGSATRDLHAPLSCTLSSPCPLCTYMSLVVEQTVTQTTLPSHAATIKKPQEALGRASQHFATERAQPESVHLRQPPSLSSYHGITS
ncbi:hypothetical protein DL96DRAFT_32639 [Flagelloscypha sp. PMI_526]|nr:hypothetical protein DL96DRAFT_32639 [Flagelloscypha sp. PMI_526]